MIHTNTQPQSAAPQLGEIIARLPAFVREKQLRNEYLQIAHGTLWDWVAKGTFPAPVKLSSGVTAWKRPDLEAWADGTWKPAHTAATVEGANHGA